MKRILLAAGMMLACVPMLFATGDGKQTIFMDNMSQDRTGELPSKWDAIKGSVEIADVEGTRCIWFKTNNSVIRAKMEGANTLPSSFEFKISYFMGDKTQQHYYIRFLDSKNREVFKFTVTGVKLQCANFKANLEYTEGWRHLTMTTNGNRTKFYIDGSDMLLVPKGILAYGFSIEGGRGANQKKDKRAYVSSISLTTPAE